MTKWRDQLNRALDCTADVLNPWEIDFIESISKQADRPGWKPSKPQADKLKQIDEKLP